MKIVKPIGSIFVNMKINAAIKIIIITNSNEFYSLKNLLTVLVHSGISLNRK